MTRFEHIINAFWLLALIPVVILFIFNERWKAAVIKKMGDARLVKMMMPGFSETRSKVRISLFAAAILLLAVGLMNLQKPVQQAGGGFKGLDVMIALDVSNSMLANDVPPNRLERARLLASKLIDTLQGNRVGIIAFAGDAYLQLPLTTDLTAARLYLQSVSTSLVPRQGTNIYDALELANKSMDPAAHDYKAVLLITDGEELDNKAINAAKDLRNAGIVVLPVGIGTANGATLPGDNGGPRLDDQGQTVISRLNDDLLKDLASVTSGTYRPMGETNQTLASIVTELNQMDRKEISSSTMVNYRSYSPILIALAFILLLIEFLLPAKIGSRRRSQLLQGITLRRKKIGAVTTLLLLAITLNAQSTKVLLHKANEAYRQKNYETAEKLYKEVLKAEPGNNVAKYNLGNIAYRREHYEDAVKNYDQATENKQEPKKETADAFNNKGLSYVQQKALPKAIESFKQSIRNNPYDDEVRNNLLKALQEQQKQNQQQNKQDSSKQNQKQPPPPQPKPNKMKEKEAEQKLNALRQEEKKIRDKMKQPATGEPSEKDW